MGLFENFPYTNFHDLNLDWIIQALKDLDKKVDTIEDRVTDAAKAYVEERIEDFVSGPMRDMQKQIDNLEYDMSAFETKVQNQFAAYTQQTDYAIQQFENLVNSQIALLRADMEQAKSQFQKMVDGANSYTDQQIALQMSKIPDLVQKQILEVHVWNLLTGKYVDIQDMFDYLCTLHVDNGSTNDEITAKNNTFTDMADYNVTFHQMLINSKLLVEQK